MVKTCWKFVFYPREAYILAQLDIMVLYIIFLVLKNIKSFELKPVSFRQDYLLHTEWDHESADCAGAAPP
jgi:hypothetical protein